MSRLRHYSPQLSRLVVSALYHEAKGRRIPMTRLADQLLHEALMGTAGWRKVLSTVSPPPSVPAAVNPAA